MSSTIRYWVCCAWWGCGRNEFGEPPSVSASYDKSWQTGILMGKEAHMIYKIALHRTDEGISVSVPALPGCWSEGDTEEEALANIQDAIREYLAALEARFKGAEMR